MSPLLWRLRRQYIRVWSAVQIRSSAPQSVKKRKKNSDRRCACLKMVHLPLRCSLSSLTTAMFTGRCTFDHNVLHRHERALCSQHSVLSTTLFVIVTNEPYVHRAVYFLPQCSSSSRTSTMLTCTGRCTLSVIVTTEPYSHRAVYVLPHCSSSSRTNPMFTYTQGGVISIPSFTIVTNETYGHRAVYFLPHYSSSSRTSPPYVYKHNSIYHQYMELLQWP